MNKWNKLVNNFARYSLIKNHFWNWICTHLFPCFSYIFMSRWIMCSSEIPCIQRAHRNIWRDSVILVLLKGEPFEEISCQRSFAIWGHLLTVLLFQWQTMLPPKTSFCATSAAGATSTKKTREGTETKGAACALTAHTARSPSSFTPSLSTNDIL